MEFPCEAVLVAQEIQAVEFELAVRDEQILQLRGVVQLAARKGTCKSPGSSELFISPCLHCEAERAIVASNTNRVRLSLRTAVELAANSERELFIVRERLKGAIQLIDDLKAGRATIVQENRR